VPDSSTAAPKPGQTPSTFGFAKWWTASGYSDSGYRRTQFFQSEYDTLVAQFDSRLEVWLPPSYDRFSWGPYLRLSGIASTRSQAWENAWLAIPGVGFQVYPFSATDRGTLASVLGPVRLFAERNHLHYRGKTNQWRPTLQKRAGVEYWRAVNVNDRKRVWGEVWSGLIWQSANEFDPEYRTLTFAGLVRVGAAASSRSPASWISPYAVVDSSLTDNQKYYWENRLRIGGGVRCAPPIPDAWRASLGRFVLYAEFLRTAAFYYGSAPASVPPYDVRVGISVAFGEWYRGREGRQSAARIP
jgi:hypothetical protein